MVIGVYDFIFGIFNYLVGSILEEIDDVAQGIVIVNLEGLQGGQPNGRVFIFKKRQEYIVKV